MKPLNIYKKINNIHVNGDDFQLKFDDLDSDKSHNKQIYLNNYDKINNNNVINKFIEFKMQIIC